MRDYRVALIEAMDLSNTNNWTPETNKYSNRVVSLTPHALKYFTSMLYIYIYIYIPKKKEEMGKEGPVDIHYISQI